MLKRNSIGSFSCVLFMENKSSEHNVLYKIKTTSPEKFLVGRSLGMIPKKSSANIKIILQKGKL